MNCFLADISFLHSNVSESESHSVVSNSLLLHGLYSPWNSPGQNAGVGSLSLPIPGIKPRSPTLQVDSLPTEPHGKPRNTGMGSLSLLQRIFLTRNQTMVSCIAGGYFPTELSGKPKIKNKTSLKRTKFITPKDAKVMQSINRPKSLL